ncbi:MAG: 4Fe-4S binding protein [Agathobacter sp.]|nr:4Fe-4S binding protein [Agathobacter sp.]
MAQFFGFAKTVMKNLFSKPATTSYPAAPREYPERTRGHVEINIDNCIMCGMCMRSCPPGAIEVKRAENTWSINRFDCIQCGYCVEKCPKKCLSIVPGYQEPQPEKSVDTVVKPVVEEAPKPVAPAATEPKAQEPAAVEEGK